MDYNNLEAAFNAGAGHFTQLVWKGSTGLGEQQQHMAKHPPRCSLNSDTAPGYSCYVL